MAVKFSKKEGLTWTELDLLHDEADVGMQLQRNPHEHVLKTKRCFETKEHYCQVSELADGGMVTLLAQ